MSSLSNAAPCPWVFQPKVQIQIQILAPASWGWCADLILPWGWSHLTHLEQGIIWATFPTPLSPPRTAQTSHQASLCPEPVLEHGLKSPSHCWGGDGGSPGGFPRSPEQQDPALGLTMGCLLGPGARQDPEVKGRLPSTASCLITGLRILITLIRAGQTCLAWSWESVGPALSAFFFSALRSRDVPQRVRPVLFQR